MLIALTSILLLTYFGPMVDPKLDAVGWAMLGASCVNAVAISWAGINAQGYVTATTFMVLANMNKFAVIAFGVAFLHEARSWQAVIGVCMALLGGVWYAQARSAASASNVRPKG